MVDDPLRSVYHRCFLMYCWPRWCCSSHFHDLGSAVQTCPLLIYGAAASLPGQNSANGHVVMKGPPSGSFSSPCSDPTGRPLGYAGGVMLCGTSSWCWTKGNGFSATHCEHVTMWLTWFFKCSCFKAWTFRKILLSWWQLFSSFAVFLNV